MDKPLLRTGDKISGNYVVQNKISAGSSGQVYEVLNIATGKSQAMKIIPKTNDDTQKEIDILARLNLYQNIARITDFGHLKIDGKTCTYVVMDFYEKGTINDIASDKEYPIFSNKELFYYMNQTLEGLKGLHFGNGDSPKIIHKDVKPANILVDAGKDIYFSDFGISVFERQLGDLGGVKGTARFMAPETRYEQDSEDRLNAGRASDIFALGIIFYKYATGVYPMDDYEITIPNPQSASAAERNKSLIGLNIWEEIPEPKTFNPNIDPALNLIISKMLVKDWNKRYQSVIEIQNDLNDYLNKNKMPRISVANMNEISRNAPYKDEETKHYVYKFNKFLKAFGWRWALGLVALLIVLAIVLLVVIFVQ